MSLFQHSVLNKYLKDANQDEMKSAYKRLVLFFHNPEIQQNIRNSKEEQFQEGFLSQLFGAVLGYTTNPTPEFNLTTEFKNERGAKKADGAILKDGAAIAVIELKSTKTKDLESIRLQAFDYKANQSKCVYVITSNFEKVRFYINNAVDFEEFDLFKLKYEEFQLLWLCLGKENLLNGVPLAIKEASILKEENITKQIYVDYSLFKRELYSNLIKNNLELEIFNGIEEKEIKLQLFKKSQKLLDRFLFIFFGEDRGLLPPNSISQILTQWEQLKELDEYKPLYDRYKKYFNYLNTGWKGKKYEIFAYNGGLFAPDEILDSIIISDEVLQKHTKVLTAYDFETDVDVNILGHIFENSLNEIEEITAQIEGAEVDLKKSKRKKDGVFYTPKYITKYIVENTVGKLCDKKKTELEIEESEYLKSRKGRTTKKLKELDIKLDTYRNWLLTLTICDPACGSGAFLNQALDFLIREHRFIDELKAKLLDVPIIFTEVENSILENNIYGVDINEESVEIAKLSLWLRTAQKGRKLTTLSNNIKCGNSLIDNPDIAGNKAFNWQNEFPEVLKNGGFDVVIGNPPYVPTEQIDEIVKSYLESHYQSAYGRINLYPIFYEKGISILKEKGILGFITPYTILKNQYYIEARRYILEKTSILEIIDFKGIVVFEDAAVDSIILILRNGIPNNNRFNQISNIKDFSNLLYETTILQQSEILKSEDLALFVSPFDKMIVRFSKDSIPLKEIVNFNQGIITGSNKKYLTNIQNELTEKVLTGSDFNRYYIRNSNQYIIYDINKLHRPRKRKIFEVDEKIILRQTGAYPICAIDTSKHYTLDTVHNGLLINENYNIKYLTCLLNSKLLRFLYENQINEAGKVFAQVKIIYIDPLPIRKANEETQKSFMPLADIMQSIKLNFSKITNRFQKYIQSNIQVTFSRKLQNWHELEFADFIKELNKAIKKAGGSTLSKMDEMEWMEVFETKKAEAQNLKSEIDKTDREIDQMVYELYGLTDEEIAIVEGTV